MERIIGKILRIIKKFEGIMGEQFGENTTEEVGHTLISKPSHVPFTSLNHIPQCIPECQLLTEKLKSSG